MTNTAFQNVWEDTKQAALNRAMTLEEYRRRLLDGTNIESGEWVELSAAEYEALPVEDRRDDILYLIVG